MALTAGTFPLAECRLLVFPLRPLVHHELMRNHTFTSGLFAAQMHANHAFSPELQAALDSAEARSPRDPDRALDLTRRVMAEARHRDSTASRVRGAGLVRERRQGRLRLYRLQPAPLQEAADWLVRYEPFWRRKLWALGEHLTKTASAPERTRPAREKRPR